jgi:hypothetical protein
VTEDEWLSPAIRRTVEKMRSRNLTIVGFRDRRGHLRYLLSQNNEVLHYNLVAAMKKRDMLEQIESMEEANRENEVHYRLKVK